MTYLLACADKTNVISCSKLFSLEISFMANQSAVFCCFFSGDEQIFFDKIYKKGKFVTSDLKLNSLLNLLAMKLICLLRNFREIAYLPTVFLQLINKHRHHKEKDWS